ncbi:MAG: hypothetical protein LBQ92_04690 [Propionibacteriaceae bacterium]|jgi:hypothetical protein|nr:hypothetical protein [Propionibacteriaceae bacterium]
MDEVGFYFRPEVAATRRRQVRAYLITGAVWTALLLLVALAIWFFFPDTGRESAYWIAGAAGVSLLFYLVIGLVRHTRMLEDQRRMAVPLAVGLNRDGLMFAGVWFYWQQVGALRLLPGRLGGADRLEIQGRDGRKLWLPIELTDASPAALDQSVRVLSSGLASVDFSRLEV